MLVSIATVCKCVRCRDKKVEENDLINVMKVDVAENNNELDINQQASTKNKVHSTTTNRFT